jgi:hypothetical protein
MWRIQNPTIKPITLDFGASEQGKRRFSQLFADDVLLINAIELVDWDDQQTQFLICQSCGMVGCASGGWVSLRVAGDLLLILPAFSSWFEDDERDREYRPPLYVSEHGIPYLTLADYQALRSLHPDFPAVEKFRRLNLKEAIYAFQLDAPKRVFGNPPERVAARKDAIVGASAGNLARHLQYIEEYAQENRESEALVRLRAPNATETVISFYLVAFEFLEWRVLAGTDSEYFLMLNSELVIVPD